ncbi:MAG: TIR domain-containing protein [Planctomycetota bacterium]
MNYDVFLSYSSKDKTVADAMCAVLESAGIRCWVAPRDIPASGNWGEAIINGINASRVMVLIFSQHSNSSQQVIREVERAVSKGIPVLPFRIEDVPLSKPMEYQISTVHWLDAFSPPLNNHLQKLAEELQQLLRMQLTRPAGTPCSVPLGRHLMAAGGMVRNQKILLSVICGMFLLILVPCCSGILWLRSSWNTASKQFGQTPHMPADAMQSLSRVNEDLAKTMSQVGKFSVNHLDLSNRKLSGVDFAKLKECKMLQSLNLAGSEFNNAELVVLDGMSYLNELHFENSSLSDEGLRHVAKVPQLRKLYASKTRITDDGLIALNKMHQVFCLDLSNNSITDLGLKHVCGIVASQLILDNTKITGTGFSAFNKYHGYDEVSLAGSKLDDAGLAQLSQIPFKVMNLRNTVITDGGLKHLQTQHKLKTVNLEDTKVTPEGIHDIKAAVPGLKVEL